MEDVLIEFKNIIDNDDINKYIYIRKCFNGGDENTKMLATVLSISLYESNYYKMIEIFTTQDIDTTDGVNSICLKLDDYFNTHYSYTGV